jgi:hypothetical protein
MIGNKNYIFLILNLTIFCQPFIISYGTYPNSDIITMTLFFLLNNCVYLFILYKLNSKISNIFFGSMFILANLYFYFFVFAYYTYIEKFCILITYILIYISLISFNKKRYASIFFLIFLITAFLQKVDNIFLNKITTVNNNISKKYQRRNIFFIGIDGLVSNRFYNKFYNNNYIIISTLEINGFITNDCLSPGTETLQTYASLVSYQKALNPNTFNQIFSNKYSQFYIESKQNGYKKQFVFDVDYFGIDQNNIFDYYFPKKNSYCNFCSYINPRWGMGVCTILMKFTKVDSENQTNITNRLNFYKVHANHIFPDSSKWFSIHHIWLPGHSSSFYNSNNFKEFNQYKETYINAIDKANKLISDIINYVKENDKNAIIIFMGDHGSWLFRNSEVGMKIGSNILTTNDLIEDKQGILVSIYPKTIGVEIFNKLKYDNDVSLIYKYLLQY